GGTSRAPPAAGALVPRDGLGVDVADNLSPVWILRHEERTNGVFAGSRQFESKLGGFLRKEFVRHLHQDAGAIAHPWIGTDRAAVLEIAENAQSVFDELMRLAALDVRDEADAARILGERGIVETLRERRAGISGGAASGKCSGALLLPHLTPPPRRRDPS